MAFSAAGVVSTRNLGARPPLNRSLSKFKIMAGNVALAENCARKLRPKNCALSGRARGWGFQLLYDDRLEFRRVGKRAIVLIHAF
jgi:hypothetical protein